MPDARPVTIVTGGSRGIGRAVALRLAREGHAVLVSYRERASAAEAVVSEIERGGGVAAAVRADLARAEDVEGIFRAGDERFGRLDALVLNAAAIPHAPVTELSLEDFDHAFAVNARAAFLAFRHAAARMRSGGCIVAVSTGVTRNPGPGTSAYAASKAALESLTRVFATEMGPLGIRVNTLQPGITDTESLHLPPAVVDALVAQTPLRRLGRPEEVADAVAFLLSDDARWVTGDVLNASGGLR